MWTLAEAARLVGVPVGRVNYWAAPWGANLIKPDDDPGTPGAEKRLSSRNLVQLALIPLLVELGVSHERIARLFAQVSATTFELRADAGSRLEWIVLVDGEAWQVVTSAYQADGLPGAGVLVPWFTHGAQAVSLQVIRLDAVKRRLAQAGVF